MTLVTLNRPERMNAMAFDVMVPLRVTLESVAVDNDVRVVVLTGAGRAFCAGADLQDGAGAAGTWPGSFWEIPTINSFESGLEVWKPTIAAVNGPCIGYGLTAVVACDFVIASDRATFGYPEVKLGMSTIVGAIRVPPKVGWANAMELLLTGDTIDAQRAREIGLAWRVVPHDDLMDEARALARRLCQGAPLAVRATKEVAHRSRYVPWIEAVRMGETMRRQVAATNDAREGAKARAEKREPRWTAT